MNKRFSALFLVFSSSLLASASDQESAPSGRNLLPLLDPAGAAVSGSWKLEGEELSVKPDKAARILLANNVPDEFELLVEFTRTDGDDSVVTILPVGETTVALELSSWAGEAHGISRIDGNSSKSPDNPTSIRPGLLENGKKYLLHVRCRDEEENTIIQASLNGRELIEWKGSREKMSENIALNLPRSRSLGLAVCNSSVTFHRVEMRGTGDTSREPTVPDSPVLEPFNGASFREVREDGNRIYQSVPSAGQGDRGAFLQGEDFSEGILELRLKGSSQPGSSFVGVVFHAEDGEAYEAVYFRPFNFGHPDPVRRGHAVQYICHPDWPWQRLRESRPEEFENPVTPEPDGDDWFEAKLEVEDGRVRAYVNGSSEPSLDIESLGNREKGKVGFWFNGIASFSDLKITPKK